MKSSCYNIIIDLGNVDYISSAGWGIFISEIKGIRENKGDLKLVRMIADVYEVFELLEFHYILKAFDTLNEAIADFAQAVPESTTVQTPVQEETQSDGSVNVASESDANVLQMEKHPPTTVGMEPETIEGKLRTIIIENPDSGMFQIIKKLNTPRFGNIKLGWFEMRKYLKQLKLDSKKKRVAYFKHHSFGKLNG